MPEMVLLSQGEARPGLQQEAYWGISPWQRSLPVPTPMFPLPPPMPIKQTALSGLVHVTREVPVVIEMHVCETRGDPLGVRCPVHSMSALRARSECLICHQMGCMTAHEFPESV